MNSRFGSDQSQDAVETVASCLRSKEDSHKKAQKAQGKIRLLMLRFLFVFFLRLFVAIGLPYAVWRFRPQTHATIIETA